jgi:hypothetical protein
MRMWLGGLVLGSLVVGGVLALTVATPVRAQEGAEIVVTANRLSRTDDDQPDTIPTIGLRRRGDFLVQLYNIVGDTRDPAKRREEVYDTLLNVITAAEDNSDIRISVGTGELRAVTKANYRAIPLNGSYGNRSDTSYVAVFVKHRLALDGSNAKQAVTAIESFAKRVKPVGRSEIIPYGDTQISIINPQQYRYDILKLAADDAKKVAALFGPNYGIDFSSFTRPVEWIGETPTEVFMYIRYGASISPQAK